MKNTLATLLLALSLNAFAAPENEAEIKALIPAREGAVLYVTEENTIFKNAANLDEGNREACPLALICTNFTRGNLVVTDKALFYVSNGSIIKRVNRADIEVITAKSYFFGNGTMFFRTTDYTSSGLGVNGKEDFANLVKLLNVKVAE